MLIIWKANFSGTKAQLEKVKEKLRDIADKSGEKVQGPFYAQDADLMWLFLTKEGNIGVSGREFLPWVAKNHIPIEPVGWEIGITEEEFWG